MPTSLEAWHRQLGKLVESAAISNISLVAEGLISVGSDLSDRHISNIIAQIPTANDREQVRSLLDYWRENHSEISAISLGHLIRDTAAVLRKFKEDNSVELAWTGPSDPNPVIFRRTDEALLELISKSRKNLYLATYASYPQRRLSDGLMAAIERGVQVHLISEAKTKDSQNRPDGIMNAFPVEVINRSRIYYWPDEKRESGNAQTGVLHMKVAVADGTWAFISSANLTGKAFETNMEMGAVIHGHGAARDILRHIENMIAHGVLVRL